MITIEVFLGTKRCNICLIKIDDKKSIYYCYYVFKHPVLACVNFITVNYYICHNNSANRLFIVRWPTLIRITAKRRRLSNCLVFNLLKSIWCGCLDCVFDDTLKISVSLCIVSAAKCDGFLRISSEQIMCCENDTL